MQFRGSCCKIRSFVIVIWTFIFIIHSNLFAFFAGYKINLIVFQEFLKEYIEGKNDPRGLETFPNIYTNILNRRPNYGMV